MLKQPIAVTIEPGSINIGDVDIATIAAGDNNIGNVDIASAIPAGANTIGAIYDAGSGVVTSLGVAGERVVSSDASAGVNVTDAPTSGSKLVITDILIAVGSVALNVLIKEETTGKVLFDWDAQALTPYHLVTRGKLKLSTANTRVVVDTDKAGRITASVMFFSEA
jgi:hypothetical protein